jgi:hypothetical protein
MLVLIGCEESQVICKSFRKAGFEAYSCDLQPCSGGHPEWHLQMDVFKAIKLKSWDLGIFHPPCTDLSLSGAWKFKEKQKDGRQQASIKFFMDLTKTNIKHTAIENPMGIMGPLYRRPNQIIQPFQFGHAEAKTTCLWLKNLPLLKPTDKVYLKSTKDQWENQTPSKNNKLSGGEKGSKKRSVTYNGIAEAMAYQWGQAILNSYEDLKPLF